MIGVWIKTNTDAMLKNQELKDYLQKQTDQRDKLENEMLEEGDKLTELYMQKDKMEAELEEILELEEKDEGKMMLL